MIELSHQSSRVMASIVPPLTYAVQFGPAKLVVILIVICTVFTFC